MIPEQNANLTILEEQIQSSRTYRLDLVRKRVTSMIDGRDAIIQAVRKILYTERYAYVIYSSQYGVELDRLIGQEYDFIVSDIKRTLTEALLMDNRIISLENFEMEKTGLDTMKVNFLVNSIEGEINFSTEVKIV
jgi:phage baseplate assembly protein W